MDKLPDLSFVQKKARENPMVAGATAVVSTLVLLYVMKKTMMQSTKSGKLNASTIESQLLMYRNPTELAHKKRLLQLLRSKKKELALAKQKAMASNNSDTNNNRDTTADTDADADADADTDTDTDKNNKNNYNSNLNHIQRQNGNRTELIDVSNNDNNLEEKYDPRHDAYDGNAVHNNNTNIDTDTHTHRDHDIEDDDRYFDDETERNANGDRNRNHNRNHNHHTTDDNYLSESEGEPMFSANRFFGGVNVRPQYTARQPTGPWKYLLDIYNQPQQSHGNDNLNGPQNDHRHNAYMNSNGNQHSDESANEPKNGYIGSDSEIMIGGNNNIGGAEMQFSTDNNGIQPKSSLEYMREKYYKNQLPSTLQPNLSLSFQRSEQQLAIQNDVNQDNSILGGLKQMTQMMSSDRT